jgi:hypothetical protein
MVITRRAPVSALLLLGLIACATAGTDIGSETGSGSVAPYPGVDAVTAATRRYLPVSFETHDAHIEWLGGDCRKCHHEEEPVKRQACRNCHAHAPVPMHKSCRGCHIAVVRDRPASAAPIECLGCHVEPK